MCEPEGSILIDSVSTHHHGTLKPVFGQSYLKLLNVSVFNAGWRQYICIPSKCAHCTSVWGAKSAKSSML